MVGSELMLRHLTLDEALPLLDTYLDDAYLCGLRQVRIVHGRRGNVLRQGVHQTLKGHSMVKRFRLGGLGEGADGATVVDFVDR
jgi:DNA mismatch repair protein MutS2